MLSFSAHVKTVVKTVSWRAFSALYTFGLTYAVSGSAAVAAGVVGAEFVVKSALYYGHEMVWEHTSLCGLFSHAPAGVSHA